MGDSYIRVGGGVVCDDNLPESSGTFEEIERPPLRHIDKFIKAEIPCLSQRYTVALMACLGFIVSFGMRCNMGMKKLQLEYNHFYQNVTIDPSPKKWSVAMESAVDYSFFWGYLVSQIPGGFLASAFPANRIFGTAIACSAFLNLFLPIAFEFPGIIICIRVLQGLVEGIWRFWAPPLERSRLATMTLSGSYAGIVIGIPLSGILTSWISWEAAFYFYGIMGILWYIFWCWLTFEKPRDHPAITPQELEYIEKSLGESAKLQMPMIPWHKISRSMPVYAIIVINICRSWNFYLLVLYQSKFLKYKFKYEIPDAGMLGALPHLLMTTIVPFGGMLADYLRRNGLMSTTNVRKLFSCGGFGLEGLLFLLVAHASTGTGAVTALTLGVAFSGFAISGYNVNHLDIAPRYASILMGVSNGIGTIVGLLCPIAIDYLTSDRYNRGAWTTVFTIAACVHLTGIIFYGVFASGELQSWAEPTIKEQKALDPVAADSNKENSFNDPNWNQHANQAH